MPSCWWLTAATAFLSEWVYNPCYDVVIIQYAYICLALTKHVWSQSNSSIPPFIWSHFIITEGPLVAPFIQRLFTAPWIVRVARQESSSCLSRRLCHVLPFVSHRSQFHNVSEINSAVNKRYAFTFLGQGIRVYTKDHSWTCFPVP